VESPRERKSAFGIRSSEVRRKGIEVFEQAFDVRGLGRLTLMPLCRRGGAFGTVSKLAARAIPKRWW